MDGSEIAQVYIQDVESSVPRPIKELKGFAKIAIKAGQSKEVTFELSKKDFSFWSPKKKNWVAEKGEFIIFIGTSSQDMRLQQKVVLQ